MHTESDIVINPHKLINNNNYISPCKNIELFASRAFPIVSNSLYLDLNYHI